MRIEAGFPLTYAKVTGAGPGSGGVGEGESRLEMGVPSAMRTSMRTATERFGLPAARSTAGTTPVRMSVLTVRLQISKIR